MPGTIITATTINGEMTGDTNIQGDVVAIVNSSGTTVVSCTYDAWGNILTTTGSMASTLGETNPLRYRGYVYDREKIDQHLLVPTRDPLDFGWVRNRSKLALWLILRHRDQTLLPTEQILQP